MGCDVGVMIPLVKLVTQRGAMVQDEPIGNLSMMNPFLS